MRLSHLGDVVCTVSLHHALHRAYPAAEIAWVIQDEFADLLEGLPGLARVIRFDRSGGLRAWLQLRAKLRDFDAHLAVDAQGNLKSALAMWCSGAVDRVGMARVDQREPLGSLALHRMAPPTSHEKPHAVDRVANLIAHVAPLAGAQPRYDVGLTGVELAAGRALLESCCGQPEAPCVLLHLSSPGDVRGWPEDAWSKLADALVQLGRGVLILSGPGQEQLGRRLRERHTKPAITHLVGQRGLRELAGLLTAAAARHMVLVSCDSGPMHVAWSAGLPVVLLAGPQAAERTGPWSAPEVSHRTVRARIALDCAPCLSRSCTHTSGPICMSGILIEDVCMAIEELDPRS